MRVVNDYKCSECGEITELFKSHLERDTTDSDSCQHCGKTSVLERCRCAPNISYLATGTKRIGSGFKDVLNKIHANSPGSQLDKTSSYI